MRAFAPSRATAAPAAPQPAGLATERGAKTTSPRGHSLARLTIAPKAVPSAAAPIQGAGLLDAYHGAKAKIGRGYDRASGFVSGVAGGVKRRVASSRFGRGVSSLYRGVKGAKDRLVGRVKSSAFYKKGAAIHGDVKAIGKDLNKTPAFQKFRAVLGVLGIAGGYQQGYGSESDPGRGSEARGAFRDRWEKYLDKLPADQQPAARLKYSLPEPDQDQPDHGPQPHEPQEIEMQPMGDGVQPPRNRFRYEDHFEDDN